MSVAVNEIYTPKRSLYYPAGACAHKDTLCKEWCAAPRGQTKGAVP